MVYSIYKKILVCCDGSKYSKKAIAKACDLAKNYESVVSLIYVVDKSVGLDIFDRKEYLKILKKFGQGVLNDAEKIASNRGISTTQILKEGKVADEVIKYAKKEKFDLIVVGSKGLGSVSKFFLGSVSTNLANHSNCSVLIVK